MTRKVFIMILLCIATALGVAQRYNPTDTLKSGVAPIQPEQSFAIANMSTNTAMMFLDMLKLRQEGVAPEMDSSFCAKYSPKTINDTVYVGAFIDLNSDYTPNDLAKAGMRIMPMAAQALCSALLPLKRLEEYIGHPAIKQMDVGYKASPMCNLAREHSNVDMVHSGYNLPQGYTGKGVVVGIIDIGFDYTHPNFRDTTGKTLRISRVWEQEATSGTAPAAFGYGRELTTPEAIMAAKCSSTSADHGSHVAGIAAGSGSIFPQSRKGMAPESEIVLVATTMKEDDILAGIMYIILYAQSQKKPCVINISIGGHIGPHDGTSYFDRCCDTIINLTQGGALLVGAAGNEAMDKIHTAKTFSSSDNTLYTFIGKLTSSGIDNGSQIKAIGCIDIWGEAGTDIQLCVNLYNANKNKFIAYTSYYKASSNLIIGTTLKDDDLFVPDKYEIALVCEINPINNKPHIQLYIDPSKQDDSYKYVVLEVKATSGTVHLWSAGTYSFSSGGKSGSWVDGNGVCTVGEIGGTGNSMISVGSYTTRNTWNALNGYTISEEYQFGYWSPFSSVGPTADLRMKPDISAPGCMLISSVNHFSSQYPGSSDNVIGWLHEDDTLWYFATMAGTSMAAPVVTGILALWLEAYPLLSVEQAKDILQQTAKHDQYTLIGDTLPINILYGYGKIDAHTGMKYLLNQIPPQPKITATDTIFCNGDSLLLSAPAGYEQYMWYSYKEDTIIGNTRQIYVKEGGEYELLVINNKKYYSPTPGYIYVYRIPYPQEPQITGTNNELTAEVPYAGSMQWYKDDTPIDTATSKNFTPTALGTYKVEAINREICKIASQPVVLAFDMDKSLLTLAQEAMSAAELNITSTITWTATTDVDWLHLDKTSGNGNQTITVKALQANTGAARQAHIRITSPHILDTSITVMQETYMPYLNVSPFRVQLPQKAMEEIFIAVNSNVSWTASADVDWLMLNKTAGSGNQTLTVLALSDNNSTDSRMGRITFQSTETDPVVILVVQNGETPRLTLSTSNVELNEKANSTANLFVYSNVDWTISSLPSWISVSPMTGNGNSQLIVTALSDNIGDVRKTSFTISHDTIVRTVEVEQAAAPNGITTPNVSNIALVPNPTSGNVTVTGTQAFSHIEIYDITGRLLQTFYQPQFSLHNYEAGIYLCKIYTHNASAKTVKLIKQTY